MPSSLSSQNHSLPERVYRWFSWAGAYAPILMLFLAILVIGSLSRALLVAWQFDRVAETSVWPSIFLHGLRVDLIMAGMAVAPLVLLLPILGHRFSWTAWKSLAGLWSLIVVFVFLFMELSTPTFIAEYDTRPNRLFIEYLNYPKEVLSMLWEGYLPTVAVGVFLCVSLTALFAWLMRPWSRETNPGSYRKAVLVWPIVALAVFMSVRSTTGHRPANPAMFALTSDALVNSLIINSIWSVSFAIYNLKHEEGASESYGQMEMSEILNEVRSAPWLSNYEFESSKYPTLHHQTPMQARARPYNLVIILEESLGATFVESLGGTPVTPRLEALKESGWWFENLYATGTRSVRGIEAVVSGFLPSPARSVLKLSLSQTGFFTLGELLKQKGYDTGFIYGGEAHFDNMRSFFTGNGFDGIADQQDYTNPAFTGSWGVSDEDLFAKTHEDLQKLHASGEPFFRLVFSSSNHTPFEYPDNRIEQYDEEKNTVNNVVKYADHALGEFIDTAQNSAYWKDTVFLIVADHDARVWGDELVPVKNFQIPGLILGADIESRRIETVTSQIDLAPTLLSLMGIASEHPMVGRDLVIFPDEPGRAIMQFNDYYAWMDDRYNVTVLRPDQEPLAGVYSRETGSTQYLAEAPEAFTVRKALAHALLPLKLYRDQTYGLPD
ncbi:Phosphoglycerol transferase MdoB [Marinobacter sp. LV10R510-11A]|uniref:LTA synthase family protein n=1 Tax=Marinobacter sp. LV10R510-11A TaxID=1415568 RepID=UPI000BC0C965|nr:LTA synthase family protein [Marinobacter sp. LV10R510-11A]SOB75481.1 Phosphoglycerol transferase MdoB [Marinobacter sp. LV10R510-11A]